MKFREYLDEAKTERAIFTYYHKSVNTGDMWDYIEDEKQTFITVKDISTHDGDTKGETMLHFIGYGPEANWDKFVKYISSKDKKLEFERLV